MKDVSHPQNSRRLRFGIPAFLVPETFEENCSYTSDSTPNTDSPLRQKLESKVCVSPLTTASSGGGCGNYGGNYGGNCGWGGKGGAWGGNWGGCGGGLGWVGCLEDHPT